MEQLETQQGIEDNKALSMLESAQARISELKSSVSKQKTKLRQTREENDTLKSELKGRLTLEAELDNLRSSIGSNNGDLDEEVKRLKQENIGFGFLYIAEQP